MDVMKIINQAKDLIINPKATMQKLRDEQTTMKDIIIYLIIVGVPTFLGILLGYGLIGWGFSGTWFGYAFGLAVLTYILSIIGVIVFGFILNALAKNFKSNDNKMQAMKLVSYAATPWLLLGIVFIFPAAGLIALLGGIYGLYILYLGLPILLSTPNDTHMSYFIVGLIIYIVIMGVINLLVGQIWWRFVLGTYGYGMWY